MCFFSVMQHAQPPKNTAQPRGAPEDSVRLTKWNSPPSLWEWDLELDMKKTWIAPFGERLDCFLVDPLLKRGLLIVDFEKHMYIYTYIHMCVCVSYSRVFLVVMRISLEKGIVSFARNTRIMSSQDSGWLFLMYRGMFDHAMHKFCPVHSWFPGRPNALRPYRVRCHNSLFWRLLVSEKILS